MDGGVADGETNSSVRVVFGRAPAMEHGLDRQDALNCIAAELPALVLSCHGLC